jgi:bacterioferritin-associated ferredoxin
MPELTNNASTNPLAKHFRQPSIYIQLTSKGNFWPDGALDLPVNGKIPVYPMTAKDEIVLRTPDALIDGTSVVQVMQSCCPNIKDAWAMPSVDVDTTLIAIRIASYGQSMAVGSKCPKCGEEHEYDVDLSKKLSTVIMPDYSQTVEIEKDLHIRLKPMTYKQVSKAGSVAYEEQRFIQTLQDPEMSDDERKAKYNGHVQRLIDLSVANAVDCTAAILLDNGEEVTHPAYIKEYYVNTETSVLRKIQDQIQKYAETISVKPEDVKCGACEHEHKLSIDFDYASFFGKGF